MTLLSLLTAVVSGALKLTHVIRSESRDGVFAVTSLGNEVFVLRMASQQVVVYDANTFTLQRYIAVPGLGEMIALAACAHYKCLYVALSQHQSIYRAELSGSSAVKKWSVASSPAGLSVNKKHNVVVACWAARKIREYTTHGALVREVSLAGVDPWHAVQLSTGDYVVSECRSKSPGAVSVVGIDGQVVRRYCPSPSSDLGEMSPGGLAVTKNDDILVADAENKRILLVNSSLSSARELALPVDDGIKEPWSLCLDESRGRLYVGECAEGEGCSFQCLTVFDYDTELTMDTGI